MVESGVSFLLQNLSQVLASEARLIFGAEDKVICLQNKLPMIHAFLKDNDGKKIKKEMEKEVVKKMREVAEDSEDVINTFTTIMTVHRMRSKLGRMIHGVHHKKLLRDVAQKIDRINAEITAISANMNELNLLHQKAESSSTREVEEEKVQRLHERRRNVEENDVVGFVYDSKEIIQRLMNEGSRSKVVSIVGMGGLGKTTLARKVYNSPEVKDHFHCRAWVYVSNECKVKDLLLAILTCLMSTLEHEYARREKKDKKKKEIDKAPQDLSNLSVQDLKQMVHEFLERKKYLLVLDDLWKTRDWDEVQDAFPNDNIDSKILITSRSKDVASHISKDPPYFLQLLSEKESQELFFRRVFDTEECPSDLKPLGKQMVKSCQGLPLSIIVLAGLLANKEKSKREWSKVVGHVNSYLTQDKTQVKDIILKLSYDNLPKRLKLCFLYFGIFPEDFEIPVKELLHQWVVEGFIQEIGTRRAEDVAEDYLYELIDRSLVQAAKVKRGSGGVKTCRIHDLLRDLCISESKEDKFFEVCTDGNIQSKTKPRRLSVHCGIPRYVSLGNDHSCIRSLFYFGPEYSFDSIEQKWLFESFKSVRVLYLGEIHFGRMLPSNLGLFIHLRYLKIYLDVGFVPDSICTLRSLQTLDIITKTLFAGFDLISFPGRLWKLTQLRHVYACRPLELRKYKSSKADVKVMRDLEIISSIVLDRQSADLFEKVRFPKLRKLGLKIELHSPMGELHKLFPSLQHLSNLNKLDVTLSFIKVQRWSVSDKNTIHEMFQSMQQLAHSSTISIDEVYDILTEPFPFPSSLTKLTVHDITRLNDNSMKALENLTNLRILILVGSFTEDRIVSSRFELNCIAGMFPQLQVLEMTLLPIISWKLSNGAMPRLQKLVINFCERLESLPNELWSLSALRQVEVWNPSEALSTSLRNLEMKNGCELTIIDRLG